jgi:hypothetical protein
MSSSRYLIILIKDWKDVPILALETKGAESFNKSFKEGKLVSLDTITSICLTLGAKKVCKQAFDSIKIHPIESVVLSDLDAVEATLRFVNDAKILGKNFINLKWSHHVGLQFHQFIKKFLKLINILKIKIVRQ